MRKQDSPDSKPVLLPSETSSGLPFQPLFLISRHLLEVDVTSCPFCFTDRTTGAVRVKGLLSRKLQLASPTQVFRSAMNTEEVLLET